MNEYCSLLENTLYFWKIYAVSDYSLLQLLFLSTEWHNDKLEDQ